MKELKITQGVKTYDIKPCPFCGGKDLKITSEQQYTELVAKNGGACIGIRCKTCWGEKYEMDETKLAYSEKLASLIAGWNNRV